MNQKHVLKTVYMIAVTSFMILGQLVSGTTKVGAFSPFRTATVYAQNTGPAVPTNLTVKVDGKVIPFVDQQPVILNVILLFRFAVYLKRWDLKSLGWLTAIRPC